MIFRNPAARIKPGQRGHAIWQPLTTGQLAEAAAAAAAPQARLCLVTSSTAYLISLRGLPATLERLRIDCQLTEAMPPGSTRCTWPKSSASASTQRSATRSMHGN